MLNEHGFADDAVDNLPDGGYIVNQAYHLTAPVPTATTPWIMGYSTPSISVILVLSISHLSPGNKHDEVKLVPVLDRLGKLFRVCSFLINVDFNDIE